MTLDLSNENALIEVIDATRDLEIGLMIYNAGADYDNVEFLDASAERALRMIRLNVVGQTLFSYHFGQAMRQRQRGGLMLIGSLSGNGAHSGAVVYSGAKSCTERFAEGLWFELRPFGVDVLCLVLSFTMTPALGRRGLATDDPNFPPAMPDEVAREGIAHLSDGPVFYANDRAEFAHYLNSAPRSEVVETMSQGVRDMYEGLPPAEI